jgi:ABC-type phosphate transport system substrate-binding protein
MKVITTMKTKASSVVTLSLVAGLVATAPSVLAQSSPETKFPLPEKLPAGTTVKIDGSKSMEAVNKGLETSFKKRFTDASLSTSYSNSKQGIEAVKEGKIDLAPVGRLLTSEEKGQNLGVKSLGYEKIAIIVGENSPFANGNITLKQFAKIYRGEIQDWSKVGDPKDPNKISGPIKVIDSPDSSDTRQAFARYPVFKGGVTTGSNVDKLTEEGSDAIAAKLGTDGISYVPVSQLKTMKGVKALSLHKTQPDDPKYPFSQPMAYVYNKEKIGEGAKALLGFADTTEGKEALVASGLMTGAAVATAATTGDATSASPSASAINGTTDGTNTASPATGDATTASGTAAGDSSGDQAGGFPWWWLLLPLLGLGAWALFGRKRERETVVTPAAPLQLKDSVNTGVTTTRREESNVILPDSSAGVVKNNGDWLKGAGLAGGAAVVGGTIASGLGKDKDSDKSGSLSGDITSELPRIETGGSIGGFKASIPDIDLPDVNVSKPVADIGNATGDVIKGIGLAGGAAIAGGAAMASGFFDKKDSPEEIDNNDRDFPFGIENPLPGIQDKAADLLQDSKDAGGAAWAGGAAAVGGAAAATGSLFGSNNDSGQLEELSLENPEFASEISALNPNRNNFSTDLPSGDLELLSGDLSGDLSQFNLDMPTGDLGISASDPFDDSILSGGLDDFNPLEALGDLKDKAVDTMKGGGAAVVGGIAAAGGMAVGAGQAAKSFVAGDQPIPSGDMEGQITLVSPNPAQAYVHWDVPVKLKRQLRQQGGKKLAVRMYDVTSLDINQPLPIHYQEFECDELAWDLHLPVPKADRQYLVEIGYVTDTNQWMLLARSTPVWIRSSVG